MRPAKQYESELTQLENNFVFPRQKMYSTQRTFFPVPLGFRGIWKDFRLKAMSSFILIIGLVMKTKGLLLSATWQIMKRCFRSQRPKPKWKELSYVA